MTPSLINTNAPATQPDALTALFGGAILSPLPDTAWIRITGEDRVRWLNGMVTNSVQALALGDGCFNFLLNAQGRIQGTAWAFAEADALLLQTDSSQINPLLALLDRFIIMDDVELTDLSGAQAGLVLAGPHAPAVLAALGLPALTGAHLQAATWQGNDLRYVSKPGRLFPIHELWADPTVLPQLTDALTQAGALLADPALLETMRLLEGTPRFGVDIRDRELPQETGQTDALHFSKGCYVGQEIVERIRSRGNVHRTFAAFRLTGPLPPAGSPLEAAGKPVGELTSTAQLPPLPGYPEGLPLALGYIRREALDSGQPLTVLGNPAHPLPLPVSLAPLAHPTPDVR